MQERLATDYGWTARQREVLDLIARSKTNQQIADALGVSLDGAKWHMREILSKLDVETREEAAEYWRRRTGLAPRFARLFRAITGAGIAGKWLATALAAGVVTGVAALGFVLLAASGDSPTVADTESLPATASTTTIASATASATATEDPSSRWLFATPGECPLGDQRPCTMAVALATALRKADLTAARSISLPIQILCPATPDDLSAFVCSPPRQPGDLVEAFGAGKAGGGAGLLEWEHTREFLVSSLTAAEHLPNGDADVQVGGVGCLAPESGGDCSEFGVLLVVQHEQGDQVLQFAFRYVGGEPGFYGVVNHVPWEESFRTGEPTPATFGISPSRYAVPKISFVPWTPE